MMCRDEIIERLKGFLSLEREMGAGDILPIEISSGIKARDKTSGGNLSSLKESVLECALCELASTRNKVVFGEGDINARLMFVGEAPGADEDMQGRPFVGLAGQLLTKIIASIGLKREEVFICNILKCRPPNNRNPLPFEIEKCRPYLDAQINLIKPQIICALGSPASKTILSTDNSISKIRGQIFNLDGIKVIPTYHPAYLLRNASMKRPVWEDMKLIRRLLNEEAP